MIVAGFKGIFTADQVLLDLQKLEQAHLIDLEEAAVVVRKKDGTVKIRHSNMLVMADAAEGGIWGLMIGTVLLNPLFGVLVGGLVGAASGEIIEVLEQIGIKKAYITDIAETLRPNSSAIFILTHNEVPDKMVEELCKFQGKLLRTSLSPKNETELNKVLHKSITLKKTVTEKAA
ncbi:MAG: DUF1269 domain-containing protein [Desulfuromonadaceae bacterium]|nr:DUF1269 domain-containing protein [Desulfuromonadaceae bacterium]